MKNVLNSIIDEKNMEENERERIRKLVFQIINEEKNMSLMTIDRLFDRLSTRYYLDWRSNYVTYHKDNFK